MRLNGAPPTAADLAGLALYGYGNYTTWRVDPSGVRGLELHLARLARDSAYLFGQPVRTDVVRELIADYLAAAATPLVLRVTVFCRDFSLAEPERATASDVLLTSRPVGAGPDPLILRTVELERELPTLKHVGLAGQLHGRRISRTEHGYDALFVDRHGLISEGATWNIGFFDGRTLTWPEAPQLDGVTRQLLSTAAAAQGRTIVHKPLSIVDIADGTTGVPFATNAAWGVVPVTALDGHRFDPAGLTDLTRIYASVPYESAGGRHRGQGMPIGPDGLTGDIGVTG